MDERRHTELEVKFDAEHVDWSWFREKMAGSNPCSFESFAHDDRFWKRGANVVRHRLKDEGAGELTVKQRKSGDSLLDRLEINLTFSSRVTNGDVEAFLAATGYERLFTLRKTMVDVFDFKRDKFKVEAALYSVGRQDLYGISGERRFLELEIKPGPEMNQDAAKKMLGHWSAWAQKEFALDPPLNLSLFEYYSTLKSPSVDTNYRI